jgi:CheY-like chemotaxis protein/MinD-like ATPase involved in chromosome partitioning or flagellar assembly
MAKILVIDDNADLLQMLRVILQDRGKHEVILSGDGADGLSRALASPPDLAIVDVMMPGITGYDVVRRMREMPQTSSVPILVLTARGQTIDQQTALQAGANAFMAKPVTPQTLLEQVENLLALQEVPQEAPDVSGIGGRLISVVSLRGGVGVTTLAVNLALSGVSHYGTNGDTPRVCLVDLSPSSGQATLHLRVRAKQTWEGLPSLGENPSSRALAGLLTPHPSGLQLLASPFDPTGAGSLSSQVVDGALTGLRRLFDLVVVDAPPVLDEAAATALDRSDNIVLVLAPEVGAIQATVAMLRVMDELRDRVALVLNQVMPRPIVPDAIVNKALRRPLALKIPYDPAQVAALPTGKPLAWAQPSSPLALTLSRWLGTLEA